MPSPRRHLLAQRHVGKSTAAARCSRPETTREAVQAPGRWAAACSTRHHGVVAAPAAMPEVPTRRSPAPRP